jgi:hypothetical protein
VGVMSTAPVSTGEILALTHQARRLADLGTSAGLDDRIRFFDHKIEILERIRNQGAVSVDPRLVDEALVHAQAIRDQYVELLVAGN